MMLFFAVLATLCIAMALIAVASMLKKPGIELGCARGEQCCRRLREPAGGRPERP